MDKEEMQHLISRQLDDILSQADRILSGAADIEDIEEFARYSEELKDFLLKNSTNQMILERLNKIPKINMENYQKGGFLNMVGGLFGAANRLREEMIKNDALEDVRTVQGYFSSIQFLYKSEIS